MTTTQKCTTSLTARDRYESFHSRICGKPATVTREGKGYCNLHDPERARAKEAAKCYERVYGRYCGKPAVEQMYGYGRCAYHSNAAVAQRDRLESHGPALLEAAKAAVSELLDMSSNHYAEELRRSIASKLEAAIAAVEGRPA